jgi:hypothetical protein
LTTIATAITSILELIDHHPLKYVALIIDVMEDIFPENVEDGWRNEEAADRHPETVRESSEGEGDDEVGEDGGHEDDQRLGGYQIEEKPHYPGEEGFGCGLEVGEPIGDGGEDYRDEDCAVVSSDLWVRVKYGNIQR